ncbi:response regulator transcription factor [Novosphingobium sp.]|uniref:response regulator transcription factor n=1 Tax=Novosphingobium sp. TaxID=1874826 RepID=UPI003D14BC9D
MHEDISDSPAKPLILVIEDEFLIREVVVGALEDAGFSVLTADDGAQGTQLFAEHSADIRGMVTDINLGEGIDGWALARTAREQAGELPVVYVSGASGHQWASQGVPNSLFITKPFAPAQIVVALSSLLVASGTAHAPNAP